MKAAQFMKFICFFFLFVGGYGLEASHSSAQRRKQRKNKWMNVWSWRDGEWVKLSFLLLERLSLSFINEINKEKRKRREEEDNKRRPKRSAVREQTTQLFFSWLGVESQRKERVGLLSFIPREINECEWIDLWLLLALLGEPKRRNGWLYV